MADPFVGEIKFLAYGYCQPGFAFCQGQQLPITQNTALYSLLGTVFGGDGRNYFNVPNLSGRAVIGPGTVGGYAWAVGITHGSETATIDSTTYAPHTHTLSLPLTSANAAVPATGAAMTTTKPGQYFCAPATSRNTTMNPAALTPYQSGATAAPHENRQPYLVLNPCIACEGIYPTFT